MSDRYEKSSWIYCGAISLALALLLPMAASAGRKKGAGDSTELTNFLLSPAHSQWLLGAVARIATNGEIDAYLRLSDDRAAEEFVDQFWSSRRSPDIVWPAPQPRAVFESRVRDADAQFSEGTHLGRLSDRGTIYILYGSPDSREYESSAKRNRGSYEVWSYPKGADAGLDGERPKREYFFSKQGERTVFHIPGARRRGPPTRF